MTPTNIDSLVQSASISLQTMASALRNGSNYRKFTEQVIYQIGESIRKNFFGVDFEFKARVKSSNSVRRKVAKHAKDFAQKQLLSEELLDINQFRLFDIYGGKLVVLSVSDNFYSPHLSIDGFLAKRKKSMNLWKMSKKIRAEQPSEIERLNSEIVRLNGVIYQELDAMCQRYVADAICDFIIHDKKLQEQFGIFIMPERFRNYNLENEYIAKHITIGSTKLTGWYFELQFKSLADYQVARTGEAAHIKRDGKAISIPDDLSEIDMDDIPSYLVYTPDGLYIPSYKECLFHHLEPVFNKKSGNNPKQLLNLFADFSEDDNGVFKKV